MDSGTASREELMHVGRTVFAQIMESVVERRGGSLSPAGRGWRATSAPGEGLNISERSRWNECIIMLALSLHVLVAFDDVFTLCAPHPAR